MRFGLMRRSSREWVETMARLSQRASRDAAQVVSVQAEVRLANDVWLTSRVKDNDPIRRRKALDRMVANLKMRQPLVAAFVSGAEAPRRYQEERQTLRTRINAAAEAIMSYRPADAVGHLQAANNLLSRIEPGVFAPEAHTDLPCALHCVELMAQGEAQAAVLKTSALLLDIGSRGAMHPSVAQTRVLRVMLVQLIEQWDRGDLLWEHKRADQVLPSLFALLQVEHLFQLDSATREELADAMATAEDDVRAYERLDAMAQRLADSGEMGMHAAALVRFCADRRLRACYWAAQDDDDVESVGLTPQPARQWAFNEACQKALQDFYAVQKKTHAAEYDKQPRARSFAQIYFNVGLCLRDLDARQLLDERSSLEVVAMLHYFIDELYMIPEA